MIEEKRQKRGDLGFWGMKCLSLYKYIFLLLIIIIISPKKEIKEEYKPRKSNLKHLTFPKMTPKRPNSPK